jgi:zinc finger protein CreA/MIG
MSTPGSRSASPPITLPPLKKALGLEPGSGSEGGRDGVTSEDSKSKVKVELPGFSEFEAAARGVPSSRF